MIKFITKKLAIQMADLPFFLYAFLNIATICPIIKKERKREILMEIII